MSELQALVSVPGYHDLTSAGPNAEQYNIIGLRQEGEEPLSLPGYEATADNYCRIHLPLPTDQSIRVRQFFRHYLVESPGRKAWDCKRFAGFVALGTPLSVSVLELPTDTYEEADEPVSAAAPGTPYEFFRAGQPTHSAIMLGNGLTLGVNGAFQKMAIGGLHTLQRAYGNASKRILSRSFSKQASDDDLMALLGARSIEEAEANLFNQEFASILRQESAQLAPVKTTPENYWTALHQPTRRCIFQTEICRPATILDHGMSNLFLHDPAPKNLKSSLTPEILDILKKVRPSITARGPQQNFLGNIVFE